MSKNSQRLCLRANRLGTKIVKKTHLDIFSKRLTWKFSQKDSPGNYVKKTHLEIKSKRITWKFCQKESPGNLVKKNHLEIYSKRLTWKLSQKESLGKFVKKTHLEIKSYSSLYLKHFCRLKPNFLIKIYV